MKIYISGPITGQKNHLEKFGKAEHMLREVGEEVINPAEIMRTMPQSTTHAEYMDISFALLKQCDAIYMLYGWTESIGAREEFEYAMRHGISITFEGGTVWQGQKEQRL